MNEEVHEDNKWSQIMYKQNFDFDTLEAEDVFKWKEGRDSRAKISLKWLGSYLGMDLTSSDLPIGREFELADLKIRVVEVNFEDDPYTILVERVE